MRLDGFEGYNLERYIATPTKPLPRPCHALATPSPCLTMDVPTALCHPWLTGPSSSTLRTHTPLEPLTVVSRPSTHLASLGLSSARSRSCASMRTSWSGLTRCESRVCHPMWITRIEAFCPNRAGKIPLIPLVSFTALVCRTQTTAVLACACDVRAPAEEDLYFIDRLVCGWSMNEGPSSGAPYFRAL